MAANPTIAIQLKVNGRDKTVEFDPRLLLVEMVRDALGLKGTHIGCLTGDCGACTVVLDGQIVKSCLRLAQSADGSDLLTLEGLAPEGGLHPIQRAFWDETGFQCGYCLPGMIFAAYDLLRANPRPSDTEIRQAISGNLCRCTGYDKIVKAIRAASRAQSAT